MLQMLKYWNETLLYLESIYDDYLNLYLTLWWLLAPLFITFLLPLIIVFLFYLTALILYIYKLHRERLRAAYETDLWHAALKTCAAIWDAHGWIWHSYEVCGIEKIPDNSAALFVFYHGAVPVDVYYFIAKTFLYKNRLIHSVADRFLFSIPGFSIISEAMNVTCGTVQSCSNVLKDNNLLVILPGGVYEAQFGNSYYKLMWKKRLGFAKVALDAKVPIIPVFTQNIRESFRSVGFGRRLWMKLYAKTKLPFVPIYGGFPVKLRSYVGDAIECDENLTAEQLKDKVAHSLENLIEEHQRIPGSILRALIERVYEIPKKKLS